MITNNANKFQKFAIDYRNVNGYILQLNMHNDSNSGIRTIFFELLLQTDFGIFRADVGDK